MKVRDVLRYSGVLTLAQLAMRSETEPAETLRDIETMERDDIISLAPKIDGRDLIVLSDSLDGLPDREQLLALQGDKIAQVLVEPKDTHRL